MPRHYRAPQKPFSRDDGIGGKFDDGACLALCAVAVADEPSFSTVPPHLTVARRRCGEEEDTDDTVPSACGALEVSFSGPVPSETRPAQAETVVEGIRLNIKHVGMELLLQMRSVVKLWEYQARCQKWRI